MSSTVESEFLIVGAGLAGGSMACFLAQQGNLTSRPGRVALLLMTLGLSATMISSAPGTADTPRAHVMHSHGVECLRELGLEDDAKRMGITGRAIHCARWCHSLAGVEYAKVPLWGGSPRMKVSP
jgi:2-polyprenyl-6-methoxyphenol hydroxylase-like FAD-dependent oxidoreductase